MDTTTLIDMLKQAMDIGIKSPAIPEWAIGTDIERSLQQHVTSDKDKEILEFLVSESELDVFNEKMFNLGTSWTRVTLNTLLQWLLFNTTKHGAEETVKRLSEYLDLDYNPAFEVLAITGVDIDQPLELDEEITLIPFSSLPPSTFKDSLDPPFLKRENLIQMGVSPLALTHKLHNPPTAALIKKVQLKPQSQDPEEKIGGINSQSLYEACECLTLVSTCTPLPAATSYIVEDWIPCAGNLGSGWSSPIYDIVNMGACKMLEPDKKKAKEIYLEFKSLQQSVRDKLRVPIQRLNQARRKQNPADKAIDLGVAFEALYLGDRSHKEQISYTFRLRAAWHLGDSQESRRQNIKLFNQIYTLRSQAVHKGTIDTIVKINGTDTNVSDFLKQADDLCVLSIKKVIENGFPDWNLLVLG